MTEQELRLLVRDAIARAGLNPPSLASRASTSQAARDEPAASTRDHASFALLQLPTGADSDGPCIIEPAVACNHCGYCKTYGH